LENYSIFFAIIRIEVLADSLCIGNSDPFEPNSPKKEKEEDSHGKLKKSSYGFEMKEMRPKNIN